MLCTRAIPETSFLAHSHTVCMNEAISVIRRAGPGDLDGILDLYSHLLTDDISASPDTYESAFEEILSYHGASLFLLEESGIFISSCILFILPNLTRGARSYGLIENVVTRRAFRGQGYATRLLLHTLQTAWDADCYKVMLLTSRMEGRIFRFYKKVGFLRGKKEGFIAYPPESRIHEGD